MTKHTELPWLKDIWRDDRDGSIKRVAIVKNEVTPDGYQVICKCFGKDDDEVEANAEFIWRACNFHYELLEALRAMVNMVDYAVEAGVNGSISNNCPTTESARKAISKALGE